MGLVALILAFKSSEIIPFHPNVEKIKGKGFHYRGSEFIHHSDLHQRDSAYRLSIRQIIFIGLIIIVTFYLSQLARYPYKHDRRTNVTLFC